MLLVLFNDKLIMAKKLGPEDDCSLRYLAHIDLTDRRPFVIEMTNETTVTVEGTALFRARTPNHPQGWAEQSWRADFMTDFESKDFVELTNKARAKMQQGPGGG